jgi:hypothetical protein
MLGDHRPLKGVQNLLRACREDIDLIAADGRTVVAVVDNDEIRRQLKLPHAATDEHVEREIRKGCRAPERLLVVLLKENMESVLKAAAACDPGLDVKRMERAVRHKDLLERDAILMELARERARPLRDCVLRKVPSLQALVDLIGQTLGLLEAPPRVTPAVPAGKRPRRAR